MGTGAFGILTLKDAGRVPETYDDLAGYGVRIPSSTYDDIVYVFSDWLTSTGGFIRKLQIFSAALNNGWVWLSVIDSQ